jgi:hypothetical protein
VYGRFRVILEPNKILNRDTLRADIRKLRSTTITERTQLEERRQRLQKKIEVFHSKGNSIFPGLNLSDIDTDSLLHRHAEPYNSDSDDASDVFNPAEPDDSGDEPEGPETMSLFLPSSIPFTERKCHGLEDIAKQELELRKGQANEALEGLRLALGYKALLYRTRIRHSTSTKQTTRAWKDIKDGDADVMKHFRIYALARSAMVSLGADQSILNTYKTIERKDLKVSKDIVEENRFSQRSDVMPWFWRVGTQNNQDSEWMNECAFFHYFKE